MLPTTQCFHASNLFNWKVRVPVMHFCACNMHWKVHWKVGTRLGSCILISVQPLIGWTIRSFSMRSALWLLEVLCCLYWHSFYQTDHSTLWWVVVGVNWLTLCQECRRAVFLASYCSFCTFLSFFLFWKISWSVMLTTLLWWLLCHPTGVRVTVAEFLICDLGRVSEWCDLSEWNLMRVRRRLW